MTDVPDRTELIKMATNSCPFYQHMGITVLSTHDGCSEVVMDFKQEYCNIYGKAHGGVLAALVDSSCGLALASHLEESETVVTIDLRINYISLFTSGRATARGKVLHRGRNIAVTETEISEIVYRISWLNNLVMIVTEHCVHLF